MRAWVFSVAVMKRRALYDKAVERVSDHCTFYPLRDSLLPSVPCLEPRSMICSLVSFLTSQQSQCRQISRPLRSRARPTSSLNSSVRFPFVSFTNFPTYRVSYCHFITRDGGLKRSLWVTVAASDSFCLPAPPYKSFWVFPFVVSNFWLTYRLCSK